MLRKAIIYNRRSIVRDKKTCALFLPALIIVRVYTVTCLCSLTSKGSTDSEIIVRLLYESCKLTNDYYKSTGDQ